MKRYRSRCLTLAWLLLLLLPVACTKRSSHPVSPSKSASPATKVGTSTTESSSKRPYVAQIVYRGARVSICSGTLISARWVLTAGHCIVDQSANRNPRASRYTVLLGQPYSLEQQEVAVDRIVRHPRYQDRGKQELFLYDAALLRLSKSTTITPIGLAAAEPQPNTVVTLLGWGCDRTATDPCIAGSPDVKVMTMLVASDKECDLSAVERAVLVCTSPAKPAGAAVGDSGGPMLVTTGKGIMVAAIISGGTGDYDVLTAVPAVLGWVRDVTGSK